MCCTWTCLYALSGVLVCHTLPCLLALLVHSSHWTAGHVHRSADWRLGGVEIIQFQKEDKVTIFSYLKNIFLGLRVNMFWTYEINTMHKRDVSLSCCSHMSTSATDSFEYHALVEKDLQNTAKHPLVGLVFGSFCESSGVWVDAQNYFISLSGN